ncbi:MAG: PAS domain S-box protein, partial [Betaproteobacteria bacterium]
MLTPQPPPEKPANTPSSAQLLKLLADNIPALVAYFVRDNLSCLFANRAYAHSFGLDELSIVGRSVSDIIGADAFAVIKPYVERAMAGETVRYERQSRRADGGDRTLEVTLIPHFSDIGEVLAAFVLINDISRHHAAEKAIRDSEERLQKFADATTEGIVFIDAGIIVDCNDAAARMMRLPRLELIGRRNQDFVAPEDFETVVGNIRSGFERPYEITLVRADGSRFVVELVGKDLVYANVTHRMTVIRDISDRKKAEAHIQFLAHHDTLTKLPNRTLLLDRIQVILATARRNQTEVGVMFVD